MTPRFRLASVAVLVAVITAISPLPARAVIILGSSAGNTSAPGDAALAIRWSQVGNVASYMGTPIASQYFLTAKHLTLSVGNTIVFPDNSTYTTDARYDDPGSDLSIMRITGTFAPSKIVPLYSGSSFFAAPLVVFGRGVPRSDTVVTGSTTVSGSTEAKGWRWASGTSARTWGTNVLDGLYNFGADGVQLGYGFDANGGANEGILSIGDSGGPVFMSQSGEWRLAGINYASESVFNTLGTGTGFDAAIYDAGGIYYSSSGSKTGPWTYITPQAYDQPAYSYSTAIPFRSAWINSIIPVPEPATLLLAATGLAGSAACRLRGRRRPGA